MTNHTMSKKKPKRAAKKRTVTRTSKSATKSALIQRPSSWWREPLTRKQRTELPEGEAAILREQERAWKVEKYKGMIRELRKVSTEFEADKGYPLTTNKLIRIAPAKMRKLEDAYRRLQNVTSTPYIAARPRTKEQLRNVKRQAAQVIPGQKVYFLHVDDAQDKRVKFKDGRVVIETTVKGGKIFRADYLFPRKPRDWDDVKRFTRQIQREGMRDGAYRILTNIYGAAGNLIERDAMQDELDSFFSTYRDGFAEFIIGWKWYGSSFTLAERKVRREKTTAERFKEIRKHNKQMEQRRTLERLGKAKRCKKCKRKKCVCKTPKFK